jgi:hypothetical protein
MRIEITLPRNRWHLGTLRLLDGEVQRLSCPCYSKSDSIAAAQAGNPTRDPFRRNGDTPTGRYRGTVERRVMEPERSYGKWPPIRLHPVSGDALTAHNNGRRGLLIHGGHPNNNGNLRATNGCIRIADKHQNELLSLLRAAGLSEIPIEIKEAL